jgi:hypothetical protein
LAGLLVAVAGLFNTSLKFGPFSNWMLALVVVGICWIVAAGLWHVAGKIEKKIAEKKLLSQ